MLIRLAPGLNKPKVMVQGNRYFQLSHLFVNKSSVTFGTDFVFGRIFPAQQADSTALRTIIFFSILHLILREYLPPLQLNVDRNGCLLARSFLQSILNLTNHIKFETVHLDRHKNLNFM